MRITIDIDDKDLEKLLLKVLNPEIKTDVKKTGNGLSVTAVVDAYHEILPELPKVEIISAKRQSAIRQRSKKLLTTLDEWKNYFTHVRGSSFLMGNVPPGNGRSKPFKADLDFLIREDIVIKTAEGKYHESV